MPLLLYIILFSSFKLHLIYFRVDSVWHLPMILSPPSNCKCTIRPASSAADYKVCKSPTLNASLELKNTAPNFNAAPLLFLEALKGFRVGVMFEDLVDPLCVEGHVDEDAGLVCPSTASAVHTYTDNNSEDPVLTNKRAAVIPLQSQTITTHFQP